MSRPASKAFLNAHAQQLMQFCRKHDLGFVVMLVEPDLQTLTSASNLTEEQKRTVAAGWLEKPIENSFHKPAVKV